MISYLKNWNHFWANKKKEMCEYDVLGSGIVRHALRNAVLPCMTLMATNLSGLVCGSFAIETIFSWNGIGKFAVESVKAKDLPVVEGYIVTVALTYIVINLIMDTSTKYLQSYLSEFCYRFNRRSFHGQIFDRLVLAISSCN